MLLLFGAFISVTGWTLREPLPCIQTSVIWRRLVLGGVHISKAFCPYVCFYLEFLAYLLLLLLRSPHQRHPQILQLPLFTTIYHLTEPLFLALTS